MTIIEQLAAYAVRERTAPIRPDVLHHTKRAIIDWFAALLPGGVISPATLLEKSLYEDMDRGLARIVTGRTATLRAAALINGTASHSVEFDDIYRDAGYHPGSPIIAAALAAAQTHKVSGEALVRAVIVGYETSSRIGMAVMPSHYRFWHTTGTIGSFGAAAAVASILECNEVQFAHALATAGTFAAALQQAFRSEANSKPLHAGHAAECGAMAAMAAKQGVTGALDILEGEAGFGAAMSVNPDWSRATKGLGEYYCITEMTFKNHGCCGHNFAGIDGILNLQQTHNIKPEDIESVKIATYKAGTDIVNNATPTGEYQAKFSMQYVVAHALLYGSVRLAAFTEERMNDPRLRALLPKIEVVADPKLSAGYPSQRAADVSIVTKSGVSLAHFQPTRKGDPDQPLTDAELEQKYRELAEPVIGKAKTEALLKDLWTLEKRSDCQLDFSATVVNMAQRA